MVTDILAQCMFGFYGDSEKDSFTTGHLQLVHENATHLSASNVFGVPNNLLIKVFRHLKMLSDI